MLKNWNSPTTNFFHAILIACDVGVGLSDFHRGFYKLGLFMLFSAGLIVGVNVSCGLARRRLQAIQRGLVRVRDAEIRELSERWPMEIDEMAELNLKKVVQAVGAEIIREGCVRLFTPLGTFHLGPSHISRDYNGWYPSSTCYRPAEPMPWQEFVASALLLLKNDPTIFDRWAKQDGFYG